MDQNEDSLSNSTIWSQIELSESYLVCCMFEEAASLSLSVLKGLHVDKSTQIKHDIQLYAMMESAGIVLVQSWKQLHRVPKILDGLKKSFGEVTNIPVSVILAGVCFQLAEREISGAREFLEEFLSKWRYVDERYYVIIDRETEAINIEDSDEFTILDVDKYLEIVEIYVFKILATALNDIDLAVSWVEKEYIPEDKRQILLRRLHSLCSLKATNSTNDLVAEHRAPSTYSSKVQNFAEVSPKKLKGHISNGDNNRKQTVSILCRWFELYFGWFRTITLKFGSVQLVISNRKVVLGCAIFIIYYVFQRKKATFKRTAKKQSMYVKKALVDLWQLAFSYQVNPLATDQPHTITRW